MLVDKLIYMASRIGYMAIQIEQVLVGQANTPAPVLLTRECVSIGRFAKPSDISRMDCASGRKQTCSPRAAQPRRKQS